MIRFRLANTDDIPQIAPLETAAAEVFRTIGMETIAEDEPISEETLLQAVNDHRLWVATEYGTLRAYLLAELLPESLHIEQVTVHPDAAHRGIGAMLIESVAADPRAIALGQITLTSFENVPWNAPYYERIGFVDIAEPQWPSGIAAIVQAERDKGLMAWPRVVMMRTLINNNVEES